jgi:hypothetical protein
MLHDTLTCNAKVDRGDFGLIKLSILHGFKHLKLMAYDVFHMRHNLSCK